MKKTVILMAAMLMPLMAMAQKGLPSVEVKDIDGNAVNVQSILDDGVPIILSFWYTTCKPCLQELGAVNDAYVDWNPDDQPDPAASLERLEEHAHGGEILLLHGVSSTNAAILGDLIDALRADGYTL